MSKAKLPNRMVRISYTMPFGLKGSVWYEDYKSLSDSTYRKKFESRYPRYAITKIERGITTKRTPTQ